MNLTFRSLLSIAFGIALATATSGAQDIISTIAGAGPSGMPAVNANLNQVRLLTLDAQNNYYFADDNQNRVYKVSTAGVLTIVAGSGLRGYSGDGALAINAELNSPEGVTVDSANPANVYIADYSNCLVRKVTTATGIITTIAGLVNHPTNGAPTVTCGYSGDGAAANAAELSGPNGLAFDTKTSTLYITDYNNGRIRTVVGASPTSIINTIAGGGGSKASSNACQGSAPYGDGGSAVDAYLCGPQAIALDNPSASTPNIFISEGGGGGRCTVREVDASTGNISLVAGQYQRCGFQDNVVATSGEFNNPYGLTSSVSGSTTTVTVADPYNQRIRQFTVTYSGGVPQPGEITTVAGGTYGFCGDGGIATSACLEYPVGVAFDSSKNMYIGDNNNNRVRKVTKSTGDISTVAGWASSVFNDPANLGTVPVTGLTLDTPSGVVASRTSDDIYIVNDYGQSEYFFHSSSGDASTLAGNGVAGFVGDGTKANSSATELNYPDGVTKDSKGNVYISDTNNCAIREVVASSGDITTIAGGSEGHLNGCGYSGDGGPAADARLSSPRGLAVDSNNNLYIADYSNCAIRKVGPSSGNITTVAGTGRCGFNGDGIPAITAELNGPQDISVDSAGNMYVADYYNQRVREVSSSTGLISTIAGDGVAGYTGDGVAIGNSLYYPVGVDADPNGNLFITDYDNNILRWVDPGGTLVTIAGSAPGSPQGSYGFGGDGASAILALMENPERSTQDGAGNFYIADTNNNRIRKVTAFAGYGRSASSINFAEEQPIGTTSGFEPITLSAIGPTTISSVTAPTGFSEIDDCAGYEFSAGETCEIDVYFQPTVGGITKGTLSIASNAFFNLTGHSQGSTVALTGNAVGLIPSGSLTFGTTQLVGTAATHTETITNTGALVKLSTISIPTTYGFSIAGGTCKVGNTLATKASCTVIVSFKPVSSGDKKSTLEIASSDPASPLLVNASGTATRLEPSPTSLAFGSIADATTKSLKLTVTNTVGTFTPVLSIAGSGFSIVSSGDTCNTALTAGSSCSVSIQFAPTTVASYAGVLTLDANAGSASPTVVLTGTGTAAKMKTLITRR